MRYIIWITALCSLLFGAQRHFTFHELLGEESGNRLLVIGGVHGDEPGGYFAPAILAQHYRIKKGSLWVVPNLNFDSIVENRRGIYGDMNRKFASIKKSDKDYQIVNDIKKIITDKSVDFVINLHDGHGFYRQKWQNSIFNPRAWGQAYIIDQKGIDEVKFGNLDEITLQMTNNLNQNLHKDYHSFNIKNTETKFKDEEMRMSLTFFAITHLKPALAIETSKNISELDQKVYYQLQSIEELMKIMGIAFERDFELKVSEVHRLLAQYGDVRINENIILPLSDIRPVLRYIPLLPSGNRFEFSHPLGTFKRVGDHYEMIVGNRVLSRFYPQRFGSTQCRVKSAELAVDGTVQSYPFGAQVEVGERFLVRAQEGIRVNVIGLVDKNHASQDEIEVRREMILPRFSVDKGARTYRVEFYEGGAFCGMVTTHFAK